MVRARYTAQTRGGLAFVAAVVALVVMSAAGIGATVVDKVQAAICSVTGGDCGDGVSAAENGGNNGEEVGATDPGSGEDGEDGARMARRIPTTPRTRMSRRPIRR